MDDYAGIHVLLRLPPDVLLRHLVWPMSAHMHLPVSDVFAPSVLFLAFRVPSMRDRLLCVAFLLLRVSVRPLLVGVHIAISYLSPRGHGKVFSVQASAVHAFFPTLRFSFLCINIPLTRFCKTFRFAISQIPQTLIYNRLTAFLLCKYTLYSFIYSLYISVFAVQIMAITIGVHTISPFN